ncbi:response regulator transcription factor [Cupriavidus basilensis]|uniref:Response regulator transcription factor n=1 Tax=Cupriavidus basilensis TaxID=68895 RepID=A0ABT6B3Q2_9BURK|nr:response regulator transcription factor [Cupriavidus basilensis]MDF3839505.1 response regulator transcription factor [Cupriavidus basilensis]
MATILLIEPHPLLRLGLRHLLTQAGLHGDLVDIDPGSLPYPAEWLCHADLMIYGLSPEPAAGWQELEQACQTLMPKRVLVLSDQIPSPDFDGAMPGNVRGLLSKACSAEMLDAAIRLVLADGECFPARAQAACGDQGAAPWPAVQARPAPSSLHRQAGRIQPVDAHEPGGQAALQSALAGAPELETPSAGSHLLNITERQYEVLALLARGYPIKTVSRLLNISVATAKTHACTLYQRLHVRNKGEAVYVALQRGAKLSWPGPAPATAPARGGASSPVELVSVCQAA